MVSLEYLRPKEPEQAPKLAYLGPAGTFTELASIEFRKKRSLECIPTEYKSITEICEGVAKGEVQFGIVPIENSTAGDVKDTLAALLRLDLQITSELIIPISQNVFVRKDADYKKVKFIKTKDQAYQQSLELKLKELFPYHKFIPVDSTTIGITMAAEDSTIAGIGAPHAAQALGLEDKLAMIGHVEENPFNATTFAIIRKTAELPSITGNDKTTLITTLIDRPGSLHHYLNNLQACGINLNKIKSLNKDNGYHTFLISIDGHILEEHLQKALQFNSDREVIPPKILGSYRRAEYEPPQTDNLPPVDYLIRQIMSEIKNKFPSNQNGTVALFTLNDEKGALARALGTFSKRGINLTSIDSMPTRRKMGEYAFYLTCDKTAEGLGDALLELCSYCTQVVSLDGKNNL